MSVVTWFHPDVPLCFSVTTRGHSPARESATTGNDMSPMPPLAVAVETETLHPVWVSSSVLGHISCWQHFFNHLLSQAGIHVPLISKLTLLWVMDIKELSACLCVFKYEQLWKQRQPVLGEGTGHDLIWSVKRPCSSLSPLFFSPITEDTTTGGLISFITMLVTCTEQSGISPAQLPLRVFVQFCILW